MSLRVIFTFTFLILASFEASFSQVLLDNFNRNNSTSVGNGWTEVENYGAANGAGADLFSKTLRLKNCKTNGINGRTYAYKNVSSYYQTIFASNTCIITWAFNMEQNQNTCNGLNLGNYGVVFVLGSSSSNFETSGNGYAVVIGGSQSNTKNRLRLVKFSGGLGSDFNLTDIISPISLGTSLIYNYSYIVTYNPSGNKWQLFYRNDGKANFVDPAPSSGTGTYTSSPSAADNSYTGSSLPYLGGYWNFGSTPKNAAVQFDNIYVPSPALTISASGPTTFCSGGSVNLTAPSGSSYLWSNGATTQTITVTTGGSYSATVNINGCSQTTVAVTVTVNPLPSVPTISASGSTNINAGGSVDLTSTAATSYLWSNGATTQTITVSTAGSYTVTITNANGCKNTSAATVVSINGNSVPTISTSGPTTFCLGESVTLTSSSASSYLWSNGATTRTITVSTSGSYSVTTTNGINQKTSAALVVTVNSLPAVPVITANGVTTFCEGQSVNLTSSSGSSYLWSNGSVTQSISASSSGSYTVTIGDANGCQRTSAVTPVTVNPLPAAPVVTASGATTFCAGGSVTLTSSSATSYIWSGGEVTQAIQVDSSGIYVVSITDANGCENNSISTYVTVNSLPAIVPTVTADGATTFCADGSVNLTSSAATSYLWSNGATTQTISANTAGSYTVTIFNANSCQRTSAATVITVNSLPAVPSITAGGAAAFCAGGSVNLTSDAATSYLWSNSATTQTISVNTAGSYTVTVTNANGCQRVSAAIAITVNALPAVPTITAGSTTTLCAGGSVNLTSSAASSYLWSDGTTNQTTSANTSGAYTVIITDANGCQRTSAATTVTVNSLPSVPTITADGNTTFCAGGSVNLTSSAASSYLWSDGTTNQTTSANTSGAYAVTITDANGCQRTSAATTVTVNSLPAVPTITADGNTTFCAGGSVNLTSDIANSYLWSNDASTQTISANTNGSYTVTVTNVNGCEATSALTTVTVNALPSAIITASGPTSFCSGSSVDLTVSSASSYLWSNAQTTQTITATTSGSYSVTITDANGCEGTSAPTMITITPCTFTWNGNLSTDWNTAGNWNKGSVPLSNDDVIIPAGTLNSPVITGTIAYRTLTINTAAGFTVNPGALLNTSGDLNNNSTLTNMGGTISFIGSSVQNISGAINFNHLIVNNGSGVVLNNTTKVSGNISLLNGSLVSNGNLNLILSTGSIEYNASDNGGISGNMMVTKSIPSIKTHYLSSPLNGSTTGDFYDDVQVINPVNGLTRLFTWNVSTQAWVASYGTSTPLNVLNGYSIFFPTTPTVLDFTGTYSHKAVPSVLDYPNVVANNYILVGNPYPATLDWNIVSGWVKTNINNAVYFWDGKNTRYASYVNGLGTNGGTQYIPSMQAFYVTAAAAGTSSIGVNNNARVTNPNPGLWRVGADDNILKLSLSSAGYTDETIIKFSENASDEFDGDLDALKIKNPELSPSLYTVSGNHEFSINTLSSEADKTIPLNVEAGFSGTYTISHEKNASDTDYSLILEDKLLKTFTDLKTEDYTFSVNPGQGNNRFSLAYRTDNSTPTMGSTIPSVTISSNEKTINISYSNLTEGSYALYNSIGQLISSETLNTTSGQYSNRPANIQPGIYIVKVLADGKVYSSKVYLSE